MVAAISNVRGVSRQRAIYERYFLPEFRPAAAPRIPEMSAESRARIQMAVRAHGSLLRVAAEIVARNTGGAAPGAAMSR